MNWGLCCSFVPLFSFLLQHLCFFFASCLALTYNFTHLQNELSSAHWNVIKDDYELSDLTILRHLIALLHGQFFSQKNKTLQNK